MAKKQAAKKTVKKPASKKVAKNAPARTARKKTAAKKPSTKKSAAKKTVKKAPAKKAVTKKTATKKSVKKKPTTKKPAATKTTKKAPAKKATSKKPATKKSAAKKTAVKKAPASKKPAAKKAPAKKPATTKKAPPKPAPKSKAPAASKKPAAGAKGKADEKGKPGRKGITIVGKGRKGSGRASKVVMPVRPMLLGPGSKLGKPLIASGPKAPKVTSVLDAPKSRRTKSPLTKAKLDRYRALLVQKRSELLGDVERMETEALRSSSGGLSHTPQHNAEQGSESYEQSLSLNLAAADRKLIKEIDDALKRLEEGTYGLCELTSQPIPETRLKELPWARYTIEAARELETRGPSL